jgi:hypothetical protein
MVSLLLFVSRYRICKVPPRKHELCRTDPKTTPSSGCQFWARRRSALGFSPCQWAGDRRPWRVCGPVQAIGRRIEKVRRFLGIALFEEVTTHCRIQECSCRRNLFASFQRLAAGVTRICGAVCLERRSR